MNSLLVVAWLMIPDMHTEIPYDNMEKCIIAKEQYQKDMGR